LKALVLHPADNVAVAVTDIEMGAPIGAGVLRASEKIPQGHKVALRTLARGENVIKYGFPIGHVSAESIEAGRHVHVHNLKTNLHDKTAYTYEKRDCALPAHPPGSFDGYRRGDGRAGIRNEIWVLPTVGCVNGVAARLAHENQDLVRHGLEGLYAFPHPFGCSQLGDDHALTRKTLASLAKNPNAAGVLFVALGCENNTLDGLKAELGDFDESRIKFMCCQEVADEHRAGRALLEALSANAYTARRERLPVSALTVGLKCGGSDGLSGVTANPVVGAFSDMLIAQGGSAVLTEVPEMFGAESILMNRCADEATFRKTVAMIRDFKAYFIRHGQVIYENPSPGNKEGGLSTLEDKSLGCIQKGGHAPVTDVVVPGAQVTTRGLTLLGGPGNDLVSTTLLTAAGAQMILFTTGRGTPFGAPVPTVKISTNTRLFTEKPQWIDFDAGRVVAGGHISEIARELYAFVLDTASGRAQTRNEAGRYREIALFKDGVIL
jgi:altronate hydrolase